jgi:hypothetical protein
MDTIATIVITTKGAMTVPDVIASSTGTPASWAIAPITEKMTKPANRLVPQLIRGTIKPSLKQNKELSQFWKVGRGNEQTYTASSTIIFDKTTGLFTDMTEQYFFQKTEGHRSWRWFSLTFNLNFEQTHDLGCLWLNCFTLGIQCWALGICYYFGGFPCPQFPQHPVCFTEVVVPVFRNQMEIIILVSFPQLKWFVPQFSATIKWTHDGNLTNQMSRFLFTFTNCAKTSHFIFSGNLGTNHFIPTRNNAEPMTCFVAIK